MEAWIDPIRTAVAIAIALFLVILRLEAERFGSAEYDEPASDGRRAPLLRRLSWFALGLALVAALLIVHPDAAGTLRLGLGDRAQSILLGFLVGAVGAAQAAAYALLRYGRIRFPPGWAYPGGVGNAVGTAFVDEAAFRGAVLGFLTAASVDPLPAVVAQALLGALATRTGAPGRSRYMLLLNLVGGLVLGQLTVATGAIGAAFLAHAVTRISLFVCTGHAGQPAPRGGEIEESWELRRPPPGWRDLEGTEDDQAGRP